MSILDGFAFSFRDFLVPLIATVNATRKPAMPIPHGSSIIIGAALVQTSGGPDVAAFSPSSFSSPRRRSEAADLSRMSKTLWIWAKNSKTVRPFPGQRIDKRVPVESHLVKACECGCECSKSPRVVAPWENAHQRLRKLHDTLTRALRRGQVTRHGERKLFCSMARACISRIVTCPGPSFRRQ